MAEAARVLELSLRDLHERFECKVPGMVQMLGLRSCLPDAASGGRCSRNGQCNVALVVAKKIRL